MSIRRYCRFFLRSFDAHFFVFAGIRACGISRTLNNAGDGDVLCEERYENVEWGNGWVLLVRVDKFGRSVV